LTKGKACRLSKNMSSGFRIRELAQHTAVYGLGDALYKAVSFILLPLYLHYLSLSEYGVLEAVIVTRGLIVSAVTLGVPMTVFKFYFESDSEIEQKRVVTTAFLSSIFFVVPGPLLIFYYNKGISNLILKSPEYGVYFSILAVNIFLIAFRGIPMNIFRAQKRPLIFVIINLSVALVTMLLNILFVAYYKMGVEGVLWGNMGGALVGVILIFPSLFKQIGMYFDLRLLKRMLRYAIPLGLGQFPLQLLFMADRYFLVRLVSLEALGIYAIGHKLGSVLRIFMVAPFRLAWGPFLFSVAKEENGLKKIKMASTVFAVAGTTVAMIISLYAIDIIRLIGKSEYLDAHLLVPFIAFGSLIFGLSSLFRSGILLSGQTERFTFIVFVSLFFNLTTNAVLVLKIGVWGACFSFITTMILFAFLSYWQGKKAKPIEFELPTIIKVLLLSVMITGISALFYFPGVLIDICYKTALLLGYIGVIYFSSIISPNQIRSTLISSKK